MDKHASKRSRAERDPDNMPITQADIDSGRVKIVRRRGRPVGSSKVQKTVRLDKDIIDALQKDGRGWQTRMNTHLRRALKLDKKSEAG